MGSGLRFGFAAPLTGPQAIVGVPMLRVVEMALRDRRGDSEAVELIALDDEADERVARQVAARIVADAGLVAMIGHKNSGPSFSAAPVYYPARVTQLSQSSTDSALTRNGWDTFFRLCADNERQATVAADYAAGELRPRGFIAVHDRTAYGRPLVDAFVSRMVSHGRESAALLEMTVGQEDFSEIVAVIDDSRVDLVYIGATEVEGGKLTAALRRAGVKTQVMTAEGGPFSPFGAIAGPAAEGSIHTYAGSDPYATRESRSVAKRCGAEIGETPSFVVECYDAVSVLSAAVGDGARSREEVRVAVAATNINGLTGPIQFAPDGEREAAPVSLWRIEAGRSVPLAGLRID